MARKAQTTKFELSKDIDRYLHALSKLYEQDGKSELRALIVNGRVVVEENWSSDTDWGETYYRHALRLILPDTLFLRHVKKKAKIEAQIQSDLNALHRVQFESVGSVFLEMDAPADGPDWRNKSGLLLTKSEVPEAALKRLWPEGHYRVFLSHKTEVKKEVAALKGRLQRFGIACFVAHEDIHPTEDWRNEIEHALASMDAFVPLLTQKFHESDWTDQEVGYAVARGVPIIPVRLGRDPYGFIGKYQALSCDWDGAPTALLPLFMKQERMIPAYIAALRDCRSYDRGNELAQALPHIKALTESQVDELMSVYNENQELRGSFGFNGSKPTFYGKGLAHHLDRLSSRAFTYGDGAKIETSDIPF